MNLSRILALILALSLCLCLLAGCGETATGDETESADTAADTAEPADDAGEDSGEDSGDEASADAEEQEAVPTIDYDSARQALALDQVVAKTSGTDITWKETFYWLHYIISYGEYYNGAAINWDEVGEDGNTVEAFYKDYAIKGSAYYAVIEEKCAEMGIGLTEEQEKEIQDSIDSYAEQYGGQEGFEAELAASYMDLDMYKHVSKVAMLYDNLASELYGAQGEKLPAEQVKDFIDAQGVYGAKHILITPKEDDSGEAEAKAQEILAKLKAGADFDTLMQENSEDPGIAANPDGYVTMPGSMVPEFEDAALALEPGEFSDVVESSFGYHIIMRTEVDENSVPMEYAEDGLTLRNLAAQEAFSEQVDQWLEETNLQIMPEYEALDLSEIFVQKEAE